MGASNSDRVAAAVAPSWSLLTKSDRLIKWGSVLASLLPLGLSIYMLAAYDYSRERWRSR